MTSRRNVLIAAACLAAAGGAWSLEPRRRVTLLGGAKVADVVPARFADWSSQDIGDLVAPRDEGSLAARLYEETVGRIYTRAASGEEILLFMAHGDTQSDQLQLHRPERCYPAFGYEISQSARTSVALPGGAGLPARRLVADAPGRRESIIYWSRLGEFLPVNASEQRLDRLRTAIGGVVADGLLARFSALGPDPASALASVAAFIPTLLSAVAPEHRAALIGTRLADSMAAARA
ncbi:MAG: exosortase-associated protein EpsI, V-type [Caulobacteraceae bacterium]